MTFKIVKTYNEKTQREELCICPSAWEKNNGADYVIRCLLRCF